MDHVSREKRSEIMRAIRGKDTKPEMRVRSALHRLGHRFRLHCKELPGKPDIILPKYHLAIFVNGCFWHGHDCPRGARPAVRKKFWNQKLDRNMERDKSNHRTLREMGWHVEVMWECQIHRSLDAALLPVIRRLSAQ